jgi:DNA (cytosine-5)-methyltransferase 3A
MSNYPNTIQLGDVTKVFANDLEQIDLIIGGSPCQGFSFAGKGLNFEDPRSKLFFEFVRLINECNPKWFFLENVRMKKEHELVISQYMKVAPIEINSALLSAQNRVRLYWTNINQVPWGLFGDMITDIPQPKDKGILLKDVLETDVSERYYLSDKMQSWLTKHSQKRGTEFKQLDGTTKASCLTTTEAKQNLSNDYIKVGCVKFGRTEEAKEIRKESMRNGKDYTPFQAKEINAIDYEKMNTLTTATNKDNLLIVAQRGRQNDAGTYVQELEPRYDNKTNTLTSVQKDNLLCEVFEKANCLTPDAYLATGEKNRENGKAVLTSMCDRRLRRLTPTECERLQTVPDGYTNYVSDTQRYRMLGNGWTVDVIAYIFSFIKKCPNYAVC